MFKKKTEALGGILWFPVPKWESNLIFLGRVRGNLRGTLVDIDEMNIDEIACYKTSYPAHFILTFYSYIFSSSVRL